MYAIIENITNWYAKETNRGLYTCLANNSKELTQRAIKSKIFK